MKVLEDRIKDTRANYTRKEEIITEVGGCSDKNPSGYDWVNSYDNWRKLYDRLESTREIAALGLTSLINLEDSSDIKTHDKWESSLPSGRGYMRRQTVVLETALFGTLNVQTTQQKGNMYSSRWRTESGMLTLIENSNLDTVEISSSTLLPPLVNLEQRGILSRRQHPVGRDMATELIQLEPQVNDLVEICRYAGVVLDVTQMIG